MLSQDRRYGLLNALPIHILAIDSFFGRTNDNILPEPLKLGIGEGLPFAVSNHMIGFAACLGFLKAFNKALWNRNIPSCSIGFQYGCYLGTVLFASPGSPY